MISLLLAAIRAPSVSATPQPAPGATPQPVQVPMPAPGGMPDATPAPDIRDIAGPVDVFPYPTWMIVVGALVLLAIVVAIAWAVAARMRNRPTPPPPTPRAIALRDLEELRAKLGALDPYAFSIAVSDVLRRFIGAQYGLRAPQQTSPEFLASIGHSSAFADEDRRLLADFLERCDLIKFARIAADASASETLLASAFAFVQGGGL